MVVESLEVMWLQQLLLRSHIIVKTTHKYIYTMPRSSSDILINFLILFTITNKWLFKFAQKSWQI